MKILKTLSVEWASDDCIVCKYPF